MLDQNGHEILDNTPVARPVRISTRPNSLEELKALLRIVSREAELNGQETFEEAEDFDVGDDAEPYSPWELPTDEQLESFVLDLKRKKARERAFKAKRTPVDSGTPTPPQPQPGPGDHQAVAATPQPIQSPTPKT